MANFNEQLESLIEKRLYTTNASGHDCWLGYNHLTDEDLRWIVDECPDWSYLNRTDCDGRTLFDECERRGIKVDI